MKRLLAVGALLIVLQGCGALEESGTAEQTMAAYEIDPNAPCGVRCQIKRAMQAWGGLVPADPEKLLHKYRGVETQQKALKEARGVSIQNEQRLNSLERLSVSSKNMHLTRTVKQLQSQHYAGPAAQIEAATHDISRFDAEKLEVALRDEQESIRSTESILKTQSSLLRDKDEVRRLGELLSDTAKKSSGNDNRMTELQQGQEKLERELTQALKASDGSEDSVQHAKSIHSRINAQVKSLATFKRILSGEERLHRLQGEYEASHAEVQQILAQPQGTAQSTTAHALHVEMLQKRDMAAKHKLGETKLAGDAEDDQQLHKVELGMQDLKKGLKSYQEFSAHQDKVKVIRTSLESVQRSLAAADTSSLDASLKKLQAKPLKTAQAATNWKETSSADLTADIENMIAEGNHRHANLKQAVQARAMREELAALEKSDKADEASLEALQRTHTSSAVADDSLLQLSESQSIEEDLPYISDEEAHRLFNADHDASFTAGMQSAQHDGSHEPSASNVPVHTVVRKDDSKQEPLQQVHRASTHKPQQRNSADKNAHEHVTKLGEPHHGSHKKLPQDDFSKALRAVWPEHQRQHRAAVAQGAYADEP